MASADFSSRLPWPRGLGRLIVRHNWRPPRVRRNPFPRLPPDLPMSHPSGYRASLSIARLPCDLRPYIRFLFVAPRFWIGLPPDPASRLRPCPFPSLRLYEYLAWGLAPHYLCAMPGTHACVTGGMLLTVPRTQWLGESWDI